MDPLEEELILRQQAEDPMWKRAARGVLEGGVSAFKGALGVDDGSLAAPVGAMASAVGPGIYGAIKNLPEITQSVRGPVAELVALLGKKLPPPNLEGAVAGSRITNRFQPLAKGVTAPPGFTVPRPSFAMPTDPTAKGIMQDRMGLISNRKAAEKSISANNGVPLRTAGGSVPSSSPGVDAVLSAQASKQSGAVRQFTPEQIAELNRQLMANQTPMVPAQPKIAQGQHTGAMKNPILREAVANRGVKSLSELSREYNVSRPTVQNIAKALKKEASKKLPLIDEEIY